MKCPLPLINRFIFFKNKIKIYFQWTCLTFIFILWLDKYVCKFSDLSDQKKKHYIIPYLNKLVISRPLPDLLCVWVGQLGLSGQDPGHCVVTQPRLALHHQHIARPGHSMVTCHISHQPGHLSRRGQGTVSRLGPPIRNMAGRPRLMETRGASRLTSLWSVWPWGDEIRLSDADIGHHSVPDKLELTG